MSIAATAQQETLQDGQARCPCCGRIGEGSTWCPTCPGFWFTTDSADFEFTKDLEACVEEMKKAEVVS